MFNVGGGEILVILAVGLIVLGPKQLPEVARQFGRVMGELRRLSSGFQQELRRAIEVEDERAVPTGPGLVHPVEDPAVVGPAAASGSGGAPEPGPEAEESAG